MEISGDGQVRVIVVVCVPEEHCYALVIYK